MTFYQSWKDVNWKSIYQTFHGLSFWVHLLLWTLGFQSFIILTRNSRSTNSSVIFFNGKGELRNKIWMANLPRLKIHLFFFFSIILTTQILVAFLIYFYCIYFIDWLIDDWLLFRAALIVYGRSKARGQIRAIAASLYHSHRNMGSQPHLWSTPQLMATSHP